MTSSPSPAKLDLGFTEPFAGSWRAKSKYMPCKVGGRPAFLALSPVLGPKALTCSICQRTLRFLLQVYAPVENGTDSSNASAFHRTLFIFACGRTKACLEDKTNFRVFRSQLPKENPFYSTVPPAYDALEEGEKDYDPNPVTFGERLCPVCGIGAPHRCGKCTKASYCSREHQILHWKIGGHKAVCGKEEGDQTKGEEGQKVHYEGLVFPELELLIGDDDDDKTDTASNDGSNDEEEKEIVESEMSKYRDYLRRNKPSLQGENLDAYSGGDSQTEEAEEEADQLAFERFKRRSSAGEALRYRTDWYRDDLPTSEDSEDPILWISSRNKPTFIPKCPRCDTERRFEFQVMPQLLNDLLINKWNQKTKKENPENPKDEDHLDWGTLLVFSCPKSCPINDLSSEKGPSYVEEFIYNQPIA